MRYWDGGQLEFVPAVDLVGLGHGIFKDLFVSLLAQDGPDVNDFRLAAGPRAGAQEEHRKQKQTHRVDHPTAQCNPVAFLSGGGSARAASGQRHGSARWMCDCRHDPGGRYKRGRQSKKKGRRLRKWEDLCAMRRNVHDHICGSHLGSSKLHCQPFLCLPLQISWSLPSAVKNESNHIPSFSMRRLLRAVYCRCSVRSVRTDHTDASRAGRFKLSGCCPWCWQLCMRAVVVVVVRAPVVSALHSEFLRVGVLLLLLVVVMMMMRMLKQELITWKRLCRITVWVIMGHNRLTAHC